MLNLVVQMIKSKTIDEFNGVEIFLSHIGHSAKDIEDWDDWEEEHMDYFVRFYEALFGSYRELDEQKLEEAELTPNQITQFKLLRLGVWAREDLLPLFEAMCEDEPEVAVNRFMSTSEAFAMSHPEQDIIEANQEDPSVFGSDHVAEGASRVVLKHRLNTIQQCVGVTMSGQVKGFVKGFKQQYPDRDPTEAFQFG